MLDRCVTSPFCANDRKRRLTTEECVAWAVAQLSDGSLLDLSGILLGVVLTGLGSWIAAGRPLSVAAGLVVLFTGLAALFIHAGHYFKWRIAMKVFGSDYSLTR